MAAMFVNAAAYEKYMGRWSVQLAPLFANFVKVNDGGKILDVGCGTGSLVKILADRTQKSQIAGIEPSQAFVDYARSRFSDPRISVDRGSAFDLPFADDTFDNSLSLLVFHLIPHPDKAAMEMRRVTRPSGTVAACTWSHEGHEMSGIFWQEAIRVDPSAEQKAERSKHCNRHGQLAELWRLTGLTSIEETEFNMRTNFQSFDDYWLPFLNGVGPTGIYVASLTPELRETLRTALHQRLLGDGPDRPFSLGATALAVRGIVP